MSFNWQYRNTVSQHGHTKKAIMGLLEQRNTLFGLYVRNISTPLSNEVGARENWQALGQSLMDYAGNGVFKVHHKLANPNTPTQVEQQILADLRNGTHQFVEFNDKYYPPSEDDKLSVENYASQLEKFFDGTLNEIDKMQLFEQMRQDLSDLGITLDTYVGNEDRLLELYLKRVCQILPKASSSATDSLRDITTRGMESHSRSFQPRSRE